MKPELIAPAPARTTKNPRVKWIKWMSAAGLTLIVANIALAGKCAERRDLPNRRG
jgi:hypothetical protein